MIHFLTIVHNGLPFIRYHLPVFESLPFRWHWHIVDGIASLTHDTAWSKTLGGRIEPWMHRCGLSVDGTSEYLDSIASSHVTIYRPPRPQPWDGKLAMVNAPMPAIDADPGILWEIDVDEMWTSLQIQDLHDLFDLNPERTAALYRCHFFVGRDLVITNDEVYGNHAAQEWRRTWRFKSGDRWASHEPPCLMRGNRDVSKICPLNHIETELHGLRFQHLAYVTESQLKFKESYYGYRGALASWRKLQSHQKFPARLGDFLPWVKDNAQVDRASSRNLKPLFNP